jgi:predicted 3-demethylubiquinone-9 3-methyltransferase (glyoxalase superfamily)
MQVSAKRITPCLWFDTQAEEAAKFYCSIFQEFEDHRGEPLSRGWAGGARQAGRFGDGGGLRD